MHITALLTELGLSPAEQTVYTALLEGAVSVKEIQSKTGVKRPTVYYALGQLQQLGLVAKKLTREQQRYILEPVEKIQTLITQRKYNLQELEKQATAFIERYKATAEDVREEVMHYDTLSSVKQAILYTLYTKEKTIYSIVPKGNFFEKVSPDFKEQYVTEKQKYDICTKALWEHIPSPKIIKKYYADLDMRPLPKTMCGRFATTVFIYDTKVLYVSPSVQKPHALMINSTDHALMTKAMFETIWQNA